LRLPANNIMYGRRAAASRLGRQSAWMIKSAPQRVQMASGEVPGLCVI